MKNKTLITVCRFFYKLYDFNLLNFGLCMLIGFLVNTYTGAPGNINYHWAIYLFMAAIALNLAFMYVQGNLKSWVDNQVVINQDRTGADRYDTREDIERAGIKFDNKSPLIIIFSILLPLMIGFSVYGFYKASIVKDPNSEQALGQARTMKEQSEVESIYKLVTSEEKEIRALRDSIRNLRENPHSPTRSLAHVDDKKGQ